jgi:hypothetical protein
MATFRWRWKMGMTSEELYVKNIEAGIRAIRLRTKSPKEAGVGYSLNKLKEVNVGLYEDYLAKYKRVVEDYNKGDDQ